MHLLFRMLLPALALPALAAAGPLETIQTYSTIKRLEMDKLAAGQIPGERLPAKGGELTISTEVVFAVPLAPDKVVGLMKDSISATQVKASETLDVEGHYTVDNPASPENFAKFAFSTDAASKALIAMSHKGTGAGLHLNAVEAATLAKTSTPEQAAAAWKKILADRARTFQTRGWVGSSTYDLGNRAFNMHQEMVLLLKTQPEILARFKDSIGSAMTGRLAPGSDAPKYYWETSRIQGDRTITLAAVFARKINSGHWQVVEPTFYVSSKYFTSLILYDVLAAEVDGRPGSVVWRGDFIITPSIGVMKGIERMAAENITLLEVKKSVESFAAECREAAK